MHLVFKREAENVLLEIGEWIEAKHTKGSGMRFIQRFVDRIATFVMPNVTYPLCKNKILKELGLCCVTIDKWVIAFRIEQDAFEVHYIIRGSLLA